MEEASKGEHFIIAKAGKPMVKVTPLDASVKNKTRRLGFLEGQALIPDDIAALGADDIRRMFEGE